MFLFVCYLLPTARSTHFYVKYDSMFFETRIFLTGINQGFQNKREK